MATSIPSNRCVLNATEIIRATGARFAGDHNLLTNSVSIDTRNISPGALFIALHGVRDGHQFLDAAARKGAAAAIVEHGRDHKLLPCFEVTDTLRALAAVAHSHLQRVRSASLLPVVAIGGAAGKTTTKELTASVMRALFGDILATPGNLNNLIGVPMTLLTLTGHHRAAVLECGTNRPGEIAQLAAMLAPEVALVLNIDIEHTEGLGSLVGVADEESALFNEAGCAIVPLAERLLTTRIPAGMRTVTFGSDNASDVRVVSRSVTTAGRQEIKLELAPWMIGPAESPYLEASLNLVGEAVAQNAAAAVAAAAAAWARPFGRDQIIAIGAALSSTRGESGRLSTRELNGVVIIDDSYNANPRSVRAALAAARETADVLHARLIIALGDMLELGELSPIMHAAAVREALTVEPAEFIAVGREFAAALSQLPGTTAPRLHVVRDSAEAASVVRSVTRPGDVLLIKGSRSIGMERVLDALEAN